MLKRLLSFLTLLLSLQIVAQVTVDINSGNPNFPFPQFLAYENKDASLGNLGTQNAPGVPHAEMELRIREAYQIMANRFSYTNTVVDGVQYVKGNDGCPYDCSEGDGYAMLAAAYMADKTTFDGLWMRTHDLRLVTHEPYSACGTILRPGYRYGDNTLAEPGGDAAADGDWDIALALLVAYKQWGDNSGITACGKPVSYLQDAKDVIDGLVELGEGDNIGDNEWSSGNVGFDGYPKGGNTWMEFTDWGYAQPGNIHQVMGARTKFVDYNAPAYYRQFRMFSEDLGEPQWNIDQFHRAEASSDWLMQHLYEKSSMTIPQAGIAAMNGGDTDFTFTDEKLAEDARHPWRHLLNYVWHGNPEFSWNPSTHAVIPGQPNTAEYDMGLRYAEFLSNPQGGVWNGPCKNDYWGPAVQSTGYITNNGQPQSTFIENWIHAGAPASIIAQDFDLMGDMYRQAEIEWNVTTAGDGYKTSVPIYFHGWFRLLGMLIYSGNFQSPYTIGDPKSNLRVYHELDKTFAYNNDQFTLTIDYRNYASIDAENGSLELVIPDGFSVVSTSTAPNSFGSGTSLIWDLGTVPGTNNGASTTGQQIVVLQIDNDVTLGNYCFPVNISSSNGNSYSSGEYPNNVTAVMERNCIDVATRSLVIEKFADGESFNPGDEVEYTVGFNNSSEAGWKDGGRPGVNVSYAHSGAVDGDYQHIFKTRIFHDAEEAYIDYGNYRISYFMYDPSVKCLNSGDGVDNSATCPNGWVVNNNNINEGFDVADTKIFVETMTEGTDAVSGKRWNQRLVVQFGDVEDINRQEVLATTTPHMIEYYGMGARIHRGGTEPFRGVWELHASDNSASIQWEDDWSFDSNDNDADSELYYPVTDDYTDRANPVVVTDWHQHKCTKPTQFVDHVLVEEWDGYTWRRVFGNGPLAGNDVDNVVVTDTLPLGLTWVGFTSATTLGETATYDPATRVITWSISRLQVEQKGLFSYKALVDFPSGASCQTADELINNKAWISGDLNSPDYGDDEITVTCTLVEKCPDATSLTLTSDKTVYSIGETISYEVDYIHNEKSTFYGVDDSQWSTITGLPSLSVSSGIVDLNGNWSLKGLKYNYSHGIDGTIEGRLDLASYQATYAIVFREEAGVYSKVEFKNEAGNIEATIYDQTDFSTPLGSFTFAGVGNPFDFKIELDQGNVNVWVGDVTGSAGLAVSGATVKAGYAGAVATVGNPGSLSNWKTFLDSGFDVEIKSPISKVNSPTNFIGNNGATGSIVGTDVVFDLGNGPIVAGTTFNLTWDAVVELSLIHI